MVVQKILSHPLMQLFSFCIILVGSAYFGGPYIWFLYHAVQEVYAYAVFGWLALAITVASIFFLGRGQGCAAVYCRMRDGIVAAHLLFFVSAFYEYVCVPAYIAFVDIGAFCSGGGLYRVEIY